MICPKPIKHRLLERAQFRNVRHQGTRLVMLLVGLSQVAGGAKDYTALITQAVDERRYDDSESNNNPCSSTDHSSESPGCHRHCQCRVGRVAPCRESDHDQSTASRWWDSRHRPTLHKPVSHPNTSFTTCAGTTPVSFRSRPWNLTERRSWSRPSWWRRVACRSRTWTGFSTGPKPSSSVTP